MQNQGWIRQSNCSQGLRIVFRPVFLPIQALLAGTAALLTVDYRRSCAAEIESRSSVRNYTPLHWYLATGASRSCIYAITIFGNFSGATFMVLLVLPSIATKLVVAVLTRNSALETSKSSLLYRAEVATQGISRQSPKWAIYVSKR